MRFRKKPVIISAEQFTEDMANGKVPLVIEGIDLGDYPEGTPERTAGRVWFHIQTLEGPLTVCPGDWVITGIKGERYPCKPDIFEATYERVWEE